MVIIIVILGKLPDEIVKNFEENINTELTAAILNVRDGASLLTVVEDNKKNTKLTDLLTDTLALKQEVFFVDNNV